MEEGILAKETHETVIRFAPPLIITKEEIDWAITRIKKVFNSYT
jgi:ornithine--oxo-acid transaminase